MLSGPRAGAWHRLATDFATLGRHPSSDLQLDPERDLDVSARHAAVFRQGPTYVVRDLGSTNGTWVNGTRIRSDRPLEPGDRIRLGARGPELEFTIVEADASLPPPPVLPIAEAPPDLSLGEGLASPVEAGPPKRRSRAREEVEPSTDLRIRMEVARQTDRLRRRLFSGFAAIALLVAAGLTWIIASAVRERRAIGRDRARLLAQVDSLQRVLANAAAEASGLRSALDTARQEAFALRGSIATERGEKTRLAALDSVVSAAKARHTPLVRAAGFDPGAIEETEGRSIVLLVVGFPDGTAGSGTGFIARHQGDTSWVLTARHALHSPRGDGPTRIALAVARRAGVHRARLIAEDATQELALIQFVSRTRFRPVTALANTPPRAGDPIAVLGFPLGLDLPMNRDWNTTGPVPTTTVASVSRVLPDLVQLDGYGVAGVSGSPAFNAAGEVIGMVFGGQPESGGRIVYAVPAQALRAFVERWTQD